MRRANRSSKAADFAKAPPGAGNPHLNSFHRAPYRAPKILAAAKVPRATDLEGEMGPAVFRRQKLYRPIDFLHRRAKPRSATHAANCIDRKRRCRFETKQRALVIANSRIAIGSQLKTYFEHDQAQPVSDRLARLLREVKSRDDAAAQEVCPQEPDTP